MKLPWICVSLVVWWRWIERVPRVQVGTVAVLRVILRRRLTARPLVSAVSMPEVATVEMMPLVVSEWPLEREQGTDLVTACLNPLQIGRSR